MGDAQIVSAWIRADVDAPRPEDYLTALERIEAAGKEGRKLVEQQLVIEGKIDPESERALLAFL